MRAGGEGNVRVAAAITIAALATACSSDHSSPAGLAFDDDAAIGDAGEAATRDAAADTRDDATHVPSAHAALPILAAHDGVAIATPQIVVVSFADDPYRAREDALADFVGGSSWLAAVGPEWGVTGASRLATLHLDEIAPGFATTRSLAALVASKITSGEVPTPLAPGASNAVVYLVHVPRGVNLREDSAHAGTAYCRGFSTFHATALDATNHVVFPFAVVADCGTGVAGDVDDVTADAARALLATAANAWNAPNAGHYLDVAPPDPWSIASGAEPPDLCRGEALVREAGWYLPRVWSNRGAALDAPCVPAAPPAHYGVASTPATMPSVDAGAQITFTLTGWSASSTAPWAISLVDAPNATIGLADLVAKLGSTSISNGATTTLTLTVPKTAQSGSVGGLFVTSGPARRPSPIAFTVR